MSLTNELAAILTTRLNWHKPRLECFCQLITALMVVRTVNLKRIALAMPTPVNSDSNYRRLQRFFKQFNLDPDQLACVIYDLFANAHPSHYLIIDRTNWKWGKRDSNILMLAISWGNTAIPLMWTVMNTPGCSSIPLRQHLICRYLKHVDVNRVSGLLPTVNSLAKYGLRF